MISRLLAGKSVLPVQHLNCKTGPFPRHSAGKQNARIRHTMSTAAPSNTSATSTPAKTSPKSETKGLSVADLSKMFDGPIDFDNLPGESFVGLNLLALNEGQADGPFVVVSIEQKEFKTGKKTDILDVYHCLKGTTPVDMPVSASFLKKAEEANLSEGDTFAVKRGSNYDSKDFQTKNCKSYLIKVLVRASKKA